MLDVKVYAVLDGMLPELLHSITVFGVDPVEYQVECGIRFLTEAENSASLFRPDKFATIDLPSEGSRMTQLLSLGQVLPSSLQVSLRRLQFVIRLLKRAPSISASAPWSQGAKGFTELSPGSAPTTTQFN